MDLVLEFGLKIGSELNQDTVDLIQERDGFLKLKRKILQFAQYRIRSEHEVRMRLKKHGCEQEEAQTLVDWLYEFDYLNDMRFAKAFIAERMRLRPSGTAKLRAELKAKGIDAFTIDDALQQSGPSDNELVVACKQAAAKKLRTIEGKPYDKKRRALESFLSRRGFAYEIVRTVVNELLPRTEGAP